MSTLHAKVTAYKGKIIIQLLTLVSIQDQTHVSMDNPSVFGQVIMNTEKYLGVSKEAIDLISRVKIGSDAIGDIDWFSSVKGDAFSWIGGPYRIVDPDKAEAARGMRVLSYVEIPNEPPADAKTAIDGH